MGQHGIHVQAKCGQPTLRNLDEQLFVLHTKQLDLVDMLDPKQLLAHIVREAFEVGIAVAIALQSVDDAKHITKLVVVKRSDHALRQGATHVTDLLANGVPGLSHLGRWRAVLDLENDERFAGLGIAADLVGMGHFLEGFLQLVSDLLGHLLGGGTRPVRPHDHGPERKGRVFILAELEIGRNAQEHQHHHQVARQRLVFKRPARQVETGRRVQRLARAHG